MAFASWLRCWSELWYFHSLSTYSSCNSICAARYNPNETNARICPIRPCQKVWVVARPEVQIQRPVCTLRSYLMKEILKTTALFIDADNVRLTAIPQILEILMLDGLQSKCGRMGLRLDQDRRYSAIMGYCRWKLSRCCQARTP